jgi:hypothetical protein
MLPEDSEACNPFILTEKEEYILELVRDMAYVTAEDIKQMVYPERSLSTAQRDLAKLAAGQNNVLNRFAIPATTRGMKQYCYTLSTKGREVLGVKGYYRPYKLRALSYSHFAHHLTLTRFVCSALLWCQADPRVRLADLRLCHQLARELGKAETSSEGSPTPAPVVPDGWLHFELLDGENGAVLSSLPILLEIDRGSEYRLRFQQHVEDRIEFIRSGQYANFFRADAVRIAYATTGSRPVFRQNRLSAMRAWTHEVLTELKLETWKNVFYFTTIVYEDIYNLKHFSEPVWYLADDADEPVRLFDPITSTEQPASSADKETTDGNASQKSYPRD